MIIFLFLESDHASFLFDVKEAKIGLEKRKIIERESRGFRSISSAIGALRFKETVTCGIWDKFLTLNQKDRENCLNLLETQKAIKIFNSN